MTANVTSVFALFIGMFIIYNTFQIAVTQRRAEIGILRALGATRRQIRTLFLGESVVAGLFGSIVGVLAGIAIARGMTGYIGSLLGEIYGIAQKADEISTNPLLMTFAVVLGVITSVVAALIPARSAARVDPVQALQKGKYQQLSAGENRMRRIAALVVAMAAAALLLVFERYRIFFYVGDALAVLAALLLTPTFALWLARALRPLLAMAAARGRHARRRQLAASASAYVGSGGGPDAVARAGGRARRTDARQLRFHLRLARRSAEPRPLRFALAKSHAARLSFSGIAWVRSCAAIPGVGEVQTGARCAH